MPKLLYQVYDLETKKKSEPCAIDEYVITIGAAPKNDIFLRESNIPAYQVILSFEGKSLFCKNICDHGSVVIVRPKTTTVVKYEEKVELNTKDIIVLDKIVGIHINFQQK